MPNNRNATIQATPFLFKYMAAMLPFVAIVHRWDAENIKKRVVYPQPNADLTCLLRVQICNLNPVFYIF